MTLQRTPKPNDVQLATVRSHLRREPENGRLWLVLAQMLSHFEPGPELQHASDEAIRLLPDNYQAWLLSASLLRHKRGGRAALGWLETVAQQNPELAAIRLARASLTMQVNPDEAARQFDDIRRIYPSDTRANLILAELYRDRGMLDQAADCLEKALQVEPEVARYWGMLAELRLVQGQWQKAVSTATAAVSLDKNQWAAREIRGDAHQKACSWDEALSDYLAIARHQDKNSRVLNKVGVCLVRQERFDDAQKYFDKALKLDPGFGEAKVNLGFLYATGLQKDKAAALISEAIADGKLSATSRDAAVTALSLLSEQQRLAPHIEKACRTGSVDALHEAMGGVPAEFSQADRATIGKLLGLAEMCRGFDYRHTGASGAEPDANWQAFIEACTHCKLARDPIVGLARNADITAGPAALGESAEHANLAKVWQTVLDRKGVDPGVLSTPEGEAWLRYWHARLLENTPDRQPGQYKAIQNTIGRETPTPPANVPGTYREVLVNMRAGVPAGVPRGVFMLLALNLVHGFCDGNGRLSRFALAWEMEAAGLPPIAIPFELRGDYDLALKSALWRQELETLAGVLAKAAEHHENLLSEPG